MIQGNGTGILTYVYFCVRNKVLCMYTRHKISLLANDKNLNQYRQNRNKNSDREVISGYLSKYGQGRGRAGWMVSSNTGFGILRALFLQVSSLPPSAGRLHSLRQALLRNRRSGFQKLLMCTLFTYDQKGNKQLTAPATETLWRDFSKLNCVTVLHLNQSLCPGVLGTMIRPAWDRDPPQRLL